MLMCRLDVGVYVGAYVCPDADVDGGLGFGVGVRVGAGDVAAVCMNGMLV